MASSSTACEKTRTRCRATKPQKPVKIFLYFSFEAGFRSARPSRMLSLPSSARRRTAYFAFLFWASRRLFSRRARSCSEGAARRPGGPARPVRARPTGDGERRLASGPGLLGRAPGGERPRACSRVACAATALL
eukprot:579933-Lingulodinium_polyedra.AAC.1